MKLPQHHVVSGGLQFAIEIVQRDLADDISGQIDLANCNDRAAHWRTAIGTSLTDGDEEVAVRKKFHAFDVIARVSVRKLVSPQDVALQISDGDSFGTRE